MKKITLFTYFIFLSIISFSLFICAEEGYYYDEIGLLTPSEITSLNVRLENFEKENDSKLMIACINSSGDKTPSGFAFDYLFNAVGNTGNGIILLLSISDGKVVIDTRGSAGEALTDQRADILFDMMLYEHFTSGDYYSGFISFIDMCDGYYAMVSNENYSYLSTNYDSNEINSEISYSNHESNDSSLAQLILLSLGIGLIAAVLTVLILRGQLKSVKNARNASDYVVHGSFSLTEKRDIYLYSTVSKIPKPQNDSSKSR